MSESVAINLTPRRIWARGRWYDRADPQRLWSRLEKVGDCWLWTGATRRGYGVIRVGGHIVGTHRLAYALARGAVPDGLVLDHLCRNRACCNPAHLETIVCVRDEAGTFRYRVEQVQPEQLTWSAA